MRERFECHFPLLYAHRNSPFILALFNAPKLSLCSRLLLGACANWESKTVNVGYTGVSGVRVVSSRLSPIVLAEAMAESKAVTIEVPDNCEEEGHFIGLLSASSTLYVRSVSYIIILICIYVQ